MEIQEIIIHNIKWVLKEMKECLDKPILCGGDKFPEEFSDGE